MIITQKYNSACDIDPEFIPSLERLLSSILPSFELLKALEKNAPENHNFAYYLFFGDKTNAPIGFAQLNIVKGKEIKPKKSLLSRFFKKEEVVQSCEKKIFWKIPGSQNEGLIFDPLYVKYASDKTNKIITEYIERDDVLEQSLHYSEAYAPLADKLNKDETNLSSNKTPHMLLKSKPNYQEYLGSLTEEIYKKVNLLWRGAQVESQLKLGEYSSFKEAFAYKKHGAQQYKSLRSHAKIEKYLKLESPLTFLTLENDQEASALVILLQGQSQHLFYDFLILNDDIDEMLLHQMAILNFYETNAFERLHYLGEKSNLDLFSAIGFSFQKHYVLNIDKKEILCSTN